MSLSIEGSTMSTVTMIHEARAYNWRKLSEQYKCGILLQAEASLGLFKLKKRNFDKYAAKHVDGDVSLKDFQIGKPDRQHLEYMICVLQDVDTLGQKERTRLRLVIDGVQSCKPSKIAGLQWNKACMTDAHDYRGGSSVKTTANYKKK